MSPSTGMSPCHHPQAKDIPTSLGQEPQHRTSVPGVMEPFWLWSPVLIDPLSLSRATTGSRAPTNTPCMPLTHGSMQGVELLGAGAQATRGCWGHGLGWGSC